MKMCWVARAEKELVRCCDLNIIYFLDEIHNMHINSKFNINSQLGYYTIKDLGVVYNALLQYTAAHTLQAGGTAYTIQAWLFT